MSTKTVRSRSSRPDLAAPPEWSLGTFCCPATLSGGPLACQRKDPHERGHVFTDSAGSFCNDRHGEGGHG